MTSCQRLGKEREDKTIKECHRDFLCGDRTGLYLDYNDGYVNLYMG